jgi:hypothetical protein
VNISFNDFSFMNFDNKNVFKIAYGKLLKRDCSEEHLLWMDRSGEAARIKYQLFTHRQEFALFESFMIVSRPW